MDIMEDDEDKTRIKSAHFSYALDQPKRWQRVVIRCIEKLTGQIKIWRLYNQYRKEYLYTGETFWDAAIRKLDLDIDYDEDALERIPKTGPLVVVANHPYGVLDGLILNQLMSKVRTDYKVLTTSVLCQAPETGDKLLPIDFSGTEEAKKTNLNTRKQSLDVLKNEGAIAVFPAGGVSTISSFKDRVAEDMPWQPFIGKLVMQSGAQIVPIYFEGQNSRLFQLASLISSTLRVSLYFKEVADRIGSRMGVVIGDPIQYEDIPNFRDRNELCAYLREKTYELADQDSSTRKTS